jgi:hypothetical protein
MPLALVRKLNAWSIQRYYSLRAPRLPFLPPPPFFGVYPVSINICRYVFLHMLTYKEKS